MRVILTLLFVAASLLVEMMRERKKVQKSINRPVPVPKGKSIP
jgi:hypothetical protein